MTNLRGGRPFLGMLYGIVLAEYAVLLLVLAGHHA